MTMAEVGFGERDAKQKTLFDCRKVVKLETSAVCFSMQVCPGPGACKLPQLAAQ